MSLNPTRKNKIAPKLVGFSIFLILFELHQHIYHAKKVFIALNSSQVNLLSFGPLTFTTVGVT